MSGVIVRGFIVAIVSTMVTALSAQVSFASTYDWSWTTAPGGGSPITGSGTLTASASCTDSTELGCVVVDSISGTFDNFEITSLVPPGANANDNDIYLLESAPHQVNSSGIAFNFVNSFGLTGTQSIYYNPVFSLDDASNFFGNFTVSLAPATTPIPAALPLFATGLGCLGLFGWRKKKKPAVAAAA